MALLSLFMAASMPVLKVLLITALGSYLATDRISILGKDARKNLNNVVFYVFNPAFVCVNLAKAVTFESMVSMWYMPVNILITFIIGSILGFIVIHCTRAPKHLRGLILGCCAAGNLGNMMLIIIPAVCMERGSPFGDPDICRTYGLGYASLSMAVGAIFLWSYVYNIVRISSKNYEVVVKEQISSISDPESCKELLLPSKETLLTKEYVDQDTISDPNDKGTATDQIKHHLGMMSENLNLKAMLSPSTAGAITGFVIGLVPHIRESLIGGDAPLHVIQESASLLADGAIPSLTLILGGNLLRGLQGSEIQKSIVIAIVVARYIALPLIGIFVVKGALYMGFMNSNPLYQFVLLLQFALPPAMNIGTMTQLFGAGESECSVIMLWTYSLASIALTFWATFFMWLVS